MLKLTRTIFFLNLLLLKLQAYYFPPAECVILRAADAGMFSVFEEVIVLMQHFEAHYFQEVKVDFAESGQYYDPSYGKNWWEYYFEPIDFTTHSSSPVTELTILNPVEIVETYNPREYNSYLIDKYIQIKPHLMEKINRFIEQHFKGFFVLGIHYRGKDKISEAPRVTYRKAKEVLKKEIDKLKGENFKIFVASDEPNFISYLQRHFPDKVICYDKGNKKRGNYAAGESALIDSVLLSRTNLLIRTSSNLSFISTLFNPSLPYIELNQRRYTTSLEQLIPVLELILGPRELLKEKGIKHLNALHIE